MNERISCFARSSRLGLMSSASMLKDVSNTIMMSTPDRRAISNFVPNCGRTTASVKNRTPQSARIVFHTWRVRLVVAVILPINSGLPKMDSARRFRRNAQT